MEFRALGRVSVRRDGEDVDLGSPGQRAVLALLLVHHGDVLTTERIIDELWHDDGDGKLNALRVYVSRLRAALDPDRKRGEGSILATVGQGYRLDVDADRYDVTRFEHGLERGHQLLRDDPAAAAAEFRSALELWTGSAFEDFAYDEFTQRERDRLDEARITAIEDRIEAELACGLGGELVSELEVLREQYPLRERLVAHQAVALYRAGRPAEALRALDRFRRHLAEELGLDPSPRLLRLEEHVLLHDESIQPRLTAPDELLHAPGGVSNPFKGLRAFGPDDAGSFFGRDALVAEMLRTLGRGQHLVAVVGASGAGKSSVVRAGLLPALAKGAVDGSDEWLIAGMVPGAHPFAELEAALLRSTLDAPANLTDQLGDGEAGLMRAALRLLPEDGHLLLVIDQFEELFTLVDDDAVRGRFLSNLVTATDDPHGRVTVIVTLRADFYGQQLHHPEFGARLGTGIVNVTPLTADELEAAALRPAEQQGVALEPALLGRLIADVGHQPGSLPLFQYALTELFDRRVGDTLTIASYRSMGGLDGALQRRASDLFEQLDATEQEAARQLFLRLVVVSVDGQRSRRRVPARELASLGSDPVAMQSVLGRLGQHRLLSFDSDRLTGAPTVEVAHEALLTSWPTLETWIEESRDDLRRHASLATALNEWELAGEHPDYLVTSARLAEFEAWEASSPLQLNDGEHRFLDACAARVAEIEDDEARRRQDEARSRRRLRTLVGALGVALAVTALFLFGVVGRSDEPTVAFFGARGGGSWGSNIAVGLDRAERELGFELVYVPPVIENGVEFRELAATGPDIVISDATPVYTAREVFDDFPDIRFGVIDEVIDSDNTTSIVFANEEGGYLAGVVAAMTTETGTVGLVGGERITAVEEFRAGFEAGVAAIEPGLTILASFVKQPGTDLGGGAGFSRRDLGALRARVLYQRGADVVFSVAGYSGFGVIEEATAFSDRTGRHVWAIGVDNDQRELVPIEQRAHVLTSIIKRGDVAAELLVEALLDDVAPGVALRIGLAGGGFEYSTGGGALPDIVTEKLDDLIAEIVAGTIEVPNVPSGPVLLLDDTANVFTYPNEGSEVGVDGLVLGQAVPTGPLTLEALGTPISLDIIGDWAVMVDQAGHIAVTHPESQRPGDRDVVFLRPHLLADPFRPLATDQEMVPADEINSWLRDFVDGAGDGAVTRGPETTTIGGRPATYFEVDLQDDCISCVWWVPFVINTEDDENTSGWSFQLGFHHRIWWIDQGDEAPVVIIATTRSANRDFQADADALLATLTFGPVRPHPVEFENAINVTP